MTAKSTSYTRNGFGDAITQTSPDTGTTTFTYDNAGNIITRTNALGQKTSFSYDALNRLTGVSSSVADTTAMTLNYDGSTAGTGRLTGIIDDAGTTAFNYTDQGLLSSVIRSVGGRVYSTSYTYDDVGRRLSLGYPSGRLLHYLRNSVGDVTGLSLDVQTGQSINLASNISFKPEGPLRHLTYGNGLSEDRTYNLSYQPESIYVGNVLNRSYEYSPDGNIINARDNLNPVYGHAVSYDAIDRMVQSTGWYGVYSFTYDASGNRTSVTRAGTKDTYSISTSNNYLTKTSVAAASYTHDVTGNITKRGSDVFTYNGYGQLAGTTVNGIPAQYKYNLSGLRVSKTVSGQTTLYFYDNDGRLLSEVDAGTGAVNREYIWLGTKPVAYLAGEQVYFIHTDNTETPQLLTNAQGNVVWTVQTYPFGKQSVAGSITFNLRYPGQYFDAETGLHYNWHRYYDPNTGRYITSDPIGLAGGLNTYAYVGNNPLGFVDPLGLDANDISETPAQRSLEQLHKQDHDVISPLVDTDLNNDGAQDVVSPVVLNGGIGKASGSSCLGFSPKIPKPSMGPGTVAKSDRDPKRFFTPTEREIKRQEQGYLCANGCGETIDALNSAGHHILRHADGGLTVPTNHAEVCVKCHKELHSRN